MQLMQWWFSTASQAGEFLILVLKSLIVIELYSTEMPLLPTTSCQPFYPSTLFSFASMKSVSFYLSWYASKVLLNVVMMPDSSKPSGNEFQTLIILKLRHFALKSPIMCKVRGYRIEGAGLATLSLYLQVCPYVFWSSSVSLILCPLWLHSELPSLDWAHYSSPDLKMVNYFWLIILLSHPLTFTTIM